MSSTYLELCQKLRQEVGIAGTGPTSVLNQTGMMSKIANWIADADVAIQGKWLDWTFMWDEFSENTIASTKDVTAPSDLGWWDTDSFWIDRTGSTPKKLLAMDYFEWRDIYPMTSGTDTPTYFIVKPDQDIILHPVPNGIYALTAEYWKSPTKMATNTSVSPIPARFDRLIVAQAKIYYAEHENAPEVMQSAVAEYMELIMRLEALFLPGQSARITSNPKDMVIRPE